MTRDKLGGEVDDERQDHQNCRDGKGNVKLALFFGVDIERDGERCAGAGQTVKNAVGHLAYVFEGIKDLAAIRPYAVTVEGQEKSVEGEFIFGMAGDSN
mgnify:CR=1 FL=1